MLAALAFVVVASTPCVSSDGAELSPERARARAQALRAILVREHEAFQLWQAGWVGALAIGAAGQAAWSNLPMSRGERAALLVGTLKATAGVVAVATMPDPDPPVLGSDDACEQLAAVESAFVDLSAAQAAGNALWRHVGSVLLNVVASVFVGLVYDDWTSAATSGLVGVAVGQAILHTRPDAAEDGPPVVVAGGGGVGLVWRF